MEENTPKIKVTHYPIKCVVCSGYGAYGREPNRKPCQACKGKGYILVPAKEDVGGQDE